MRWGQMVPPCALSQRSHGVPMLVWSWRSRCWSRWQSKSYAKQTKIVSLFLHILLKPLRLSNLKCKVKSKFPSVSYSDLWIYAACVAIEEMGGEKVALFANGLWSFSCTFLLCQFFSMKLWNCMKLAWKDWFFAVQSHRCLLPQGARTKPVVLNALCGKVQPARRQQLLQFWDTLPWDFQLKL